jgi:hypothetical protein
MDSKLSPLQKKSAVFEVLAGKCGDNIDELFGVSDSNRMVRSLLAGDFKNAPGTYGVPDNLIVKDNVIKGLEEYKYWEPDTWKQIADAAEKNPRKFVKSGVRINGKQYKLQFFQHKNTLDILGSKTDELSEWGIKGIDNSDEASYILKVTDDVKSADLNRVESIIENQLDIDLEIQKVPATHGDIDNLFTTL